MLAHLLATLWHHWTVTGGPPLRCLPPHIPLWCINPGGPMT